MKFAYLPSPSSGIIFQSFFQELIRVSSGIRAVKRVFLPNLTPADLTSAGSSDSPHRIVQASERLNIIPLSQLQGRFGGMRFASQKVLN
jgi:hypothetical protein